MLAAGRPFLVPGQEHTRLDFGQRNATVHDANTLDQIVAFQTDVIAVLLVRRIDVSPVAERERSQRSVKLSDVSGFERKGEDTRHTHSNY